MDAWERDLDDLSLLELQDRVAELASHIYAGTCRWLDLVAELDRRWSESGPRSCAEWLAWRCALSPRAAREHVRVARRLGELPLIHAAFARGELSYAKVRALTRVAEAETEEELLDLARCLTAAQLDRAVGAYRRMTTKDAKELQETAYVSYCWDDDGALYFQGRLAPEDAAVFLRGLEAGRDVLRERKNEYEPERFERLERGPAGPHDPVYRPSNADALVAMADLALSSGERSGGERYQVVVHADAGVLSDTAEGACTTEDGAALAPETARRLSCDSSLVEVTERDGKPLSVGRKTRTVPPAMRHALRTRDRGCRFPGCENHRFVDAHHVQHWALGGETKLENLILLCRRHHTLVHEGGYSIEALGDGSVRFRDPWGLPIPQVPRPPPGEAEWLPDANRELRIGPGTCTAGTGERMDRLSFELTVEAIAEIAARASDERTDVVYGAAG